jgi:hypothetical protein
MSEQVAFGMTLNPRTALKFTNYSTGCGMKLTASDRLGGTFFIQAVGVYSKFGVTQYRTSNAIEADAGK